MKRWSSLRRTGAPIPVALMAVSSGGFLLGRSFPLTALLLGGLRRRDHRGGHGARSGGDRLDDIVIAGAAADIAFQLLADGAVVEIAALAAHEIDRGHDHAG